MKRNGPEENAVAGLIAEIIRTDHARILATLIRLLGDFDLAEDALQNAVATALETWPANGVPANPRSWLISTGRNKAVDAIRKESRTFAALYQAAQQLPASQELFPAFDANNWGDDRLQLIFTCCHPLLSTEAQIALTLREVCGLTTDEIARAFLCSNTTIAQRIVRAKAKIRTKNIRYEVPDEDALPGRLQSVLQITYLLFNEGYYATSGASLTRLKLSAEAIRLGRLLVELIPEPEVKGLLGLMLLNEARRDARATAEGDIILLSDQDQQLWDKQVILQGIAFTTEALSSGEPGPITLQAAIAATHIAGAMSGITDWDKIIELYNQIAASNPSPIVALNRAAAISMRDGPFAGLALIDVMFNAGELLGYSLAHSTMADCYRRLQQYAQAKECYLAALKHTEQAAEQRFLEKRIQEMSRLLAE